MSPAAPASASAPASGPVLPDPRPSADDAAYTVDQRVLAEQTRLVFDRSRLSGLVKLPFALLVCWLLRHHAPMPVLVVWFAALCLTTAFRIRVDRRNQRATPAQAPRNLRLFQAALFADGLCFGLISLLPFNDPGSLQAIMLVAAVIAAESVAFVVLNAHYTTMLVHVLPALAPSVTWQFMQGTETGLFIGVGGTLFAALVMSDGRNAYLHTRDMLRLRFQMNELAVQRAQALALAEQHSAVKSRFLATMSHEIRTPLHGVIGLARLLAGDVRRRDFESGGRHIETLRVTSEHLLAVINDTLDFSAMENQRLQLQREPFDLAQLLREVSDVARITAAEKRLAVELELHFGEPFWVAGDAARLRQILLNLTGNAVKFTERGSIRIDAARGDGPATRIRVTDTGVGIDAAALEVIFEAFNPGDPARGRRHEGTGLGLAIARELARAMDGELVCESRPGTGSTFTLTAMLPAVSAQQALPGSAPSPVSTQDSAGPANAAAGAGGEVRVLLVDDNRLNAYVAEVTIAGFGYRVERASDGAEALERARDGGFDLILMDCQMPVLDGFEATQRIREHERSLGLRPVPIIALTASALESDRQRSFACGMNGHLVKPFSPAELEAAVRRALAAPASAVPAPAGRSHDIEATP